MRNRNFRLYLVGHAISAQGDWAQKIAQAWLVLELSDSGVLLGVTAALQALPTFVIGPWGGLAGDRLDKRRLLLYTQPAAAALAVLLGALVAFDAVEIWMVLVFALALGSVHAFSHPLKQNLILDMVGGQDIANAVTLGSVVRNVAKVTGPAIAGLLIASIGLAGSFIVNGASYFCLVAALLFLRTDQMHPAPSARRRPGQLREGVRYVLRTPKLRSPLIFMTAWSIFGYEWPVTLPLLARAEFGGGAEVFGVMFSAMGVGAVAGGLVLAGILRPTRRSLMVAGIVFGALTMLTAASPLLPLTLLILVPIGAAAIAVRATGTALVQLRTEPEFRGRVMALLAVALTGGTAVGAPLVGWLADAFGIRPTLALGGVVTVIAAWCLRTAVPRAGIRHKSATTGSHPRREDAGPPKPETRASPRE